MKGRAAATVRERYLRLGLQVGRHVEGIVDAYCGPREVAAAVGAEPAVDPRALVIAAEALRDELEDGWLRDQVFGLRTYAGVLAGESRSYADEVEGCYGVRPTYTDEAVFTAAHERLERLLPAHMIRFFSEATSRTYVITYPAGGELCRSYVAGEPERFRRLLTEQVRVGDLLPARDSHSSTSSAAGPASELS